MSPAERTDLWYLFFAYTGLFVIFFGFMVRMLNLSRNLRRDVELLKREWGQNSDEESPRSATSVTPTVHSRSQ